MEFDWNHARAFLVTAEQGSLSAAARVLGLTQPTLGRQVNALERELGVTLFQRVGRGLTLTQSGAYLLEHVKSMGMAAGHVSLAAMGQSQSITGTVCISVSEIYATLVMPQIVMEIRDREPGITIEVVATNEISDLQKREADIAVRAVRPTQSELITKKIKEMSATFYATPGYLQKIGPAKTIQDLTHAHFISVGSCEAYKKAMAGSGLMLTDENISVVCESHLVHWEMTKMGLGIGLVPTHIGDAEPSVQRVIAGLDLIQFPIWLTTHRELRTSKRIQLVFDLLAEALAA
ncbi:LysR family transcriptional regulator [Arenicella chitinivorans]|uniref:LysR family transcriptional regulator n=1 Tax=Arenicella chitinivorans TaxID=1329800 RepID=A0A918VEZ0_9GAMM|nr:LysR family transcriptional regulator [Arenicella chitinivorans]GGZ95921.1 LysR family transcriptional regulator [Arenicella chitinivorans]